MRTPSGRRLRQHRRTTASDTRRQQTNLVLLARLSNGLVAPAPSAVHRRPNARAGRRLGLMPPDRRLGARRREGSASRESERNRHDRHDAHGSTSPRSAFEPHSACRNRSIHFAIPPPAPGSRSASRSRRGRSARCLGADYVPLAGVDTALKHDDGNHTRWGPARRVDERPRSGASRRQGRRRKKAWADYRCPAKRDAGTLALTGHQELSLPSSSTVADLPARIQRGRWRCRSAGRSWWPRGAGRLRRPLGRAARTGLRAPPSS
jgi:hypothetical protein